VGDLAAAEATAETTRNRAVIEGVTSANLATGDIDGALRVILLFEREAPGGGSPSQRMPMPPTLVGRVVRALAARRSPEEAEDWLARYPEEAWPLEAWEALASVYRKGKGNVSAIETVMRRMRAAGHRPTGDVWAQWLYAFPRGKRAVRVARALATMRADERTPTPSFFTAAIVGALQPAKVTVPPGGDVEAIAWQNAQVAMNAGEELLVKAATQLARSGGPSGEPEGWFSAGQLLEIARAYPLGRRPYAQVDTAVEVRVAEETEPAEQFAAFLGAVAAAHARALLPEGVRRLRRVAARVDLDDRPELAAALLDSLADAPEKIRPAVMHEIASGHLAATVVADAAGRALARAGAAEVVAQVLDRARPTLPEDQAERVLSAAVLAYEDAGQIEAARQVGVIAEQRSLSLSPAAQGALLTTHRPADPVQQEQGPVWTTAQLAAYNGLLQHEFANQLQTSRTRTLLMGSALRNLRAKLPAEVAAETKKYLDALDGVEEALRLNQDAQQRTIDKIAAAAQQERTAAGAVPVLEAMDSVAAQLAEEAEAAATDITVLDRDDAARAMVRGHATLVHFALHNLVSNAIKAHKRCNDGLRRQIELLVRFDESDREDLAVAPYGWVIVSVRDHGDGVPDDLPDNVANWSMPGQPGQGAGIGLSRTENMLRGSGGQLWIDTSVTGGSRFCFRLPSAARRQARGVPNTPREDQNNA
jgi:signal transduction histidine kinase